MNVFSDFREIKYKQKNVDFHSVKHLNKHKDTVEFFDLLFKKYIQFVHLPLSSKFIFVMKKLNGYDDILKSVLEQFSYLDITILTINDKYTNSLVDKNKDDFLCQYLFMEMQQQSNCTLISNDRYRDKNIYINLFNFDMHISMIKWNHTQNCVDTVSHSFKINSEFRNKLFLQNCKRCTIPKHNLHKII
jgi:hypothetical protein